jgi:hypothetical protein
MNINAIAGWPNQARARRDFKRGVRAAVRRSLILAAALSLPAHAQAEAVKPALKPIDIFDLQWAADPEISPDARSIAYVRMQFDIKTDRRRGQVWLMGIDGKHSRPLSSAASSSSPRW